MGFSLTESYRLGVLTMEERAARKAAANVVPRQDLGSGRDIMASGLKQGAVIIP